MQKNFVKTRRVLRQRRLAAEPVHYVQNRAGNLNGKDAATAVLAPPVDDIPNQVLKRVGEQGNGTDNAR